MPVNCWGGRALLCSPVATLLNMSQCIVFYVENNITRMNFSHGRKSRWLWKVFIWQNLRWIQCNDLKCIRKLTKAFSCILPPMRMSINKHLTSSSVTDRELSADRCLQSRDSSSRSSRQEHFPRRYAAYINNIRRTLVVRSTRRSTLGDRAFPVAAARAWNSLPPSVRSTSSLASFCLHL